MTLTQLEYVVAVDTYGSFSLAAEKSLVTQPTLSMQIRKLEEQLDAVLFDRSKQPVIPTSVGKMVIEQARIVLREARQLPEIISDSKKTTSGNLVIGMIPTIAPYLMPYFLGQFSRQYPEVHLEIRELKTGEIIDLLQRDLLDAGILATPLHEEKIIEEVLYYEEILLYLHPKHHLVGKEHIHPDLLDPHDMWMLTEGNCFRDHAINLCSLGSDLPIRNLKYESGSLETLKKMVDVEGGHMLLPELAAMELPSRELKRIRHFALPVPLREISLVYARSVAKRQLMDNLRTVIQAALPEELADRSRGRMVEWA
jgi:LysR family hydrogen peroxide-inducible transcriptional activator